MGSHVSLLRESQIPILSTIVASPSRVRKTLLTLVFSLLTYLTLRDLASIVSDYLSYPVTVSVLVTESRVLPFPAVTVCNLNPVHRHRFCTYDRLEKPRSLHLVLCSSMSDLLRVCNVTRDLHRLVQQGKRICEGRKGDGSEDSAPGGAGSRRRAFKRPAGRKRRPRTEAPDTESPTSLASLAAATSEDLSDKTTDPSLEDSRSSSEPTGTGRKRMRLKPKKAKTPLASKGIDESSGNSSFTDKTYFLPLTGHPSTPAPRARGRLTARPARTRAPDQRAHVS